MNLEDGAELFITGGRGGGRGGSSDDSGSGNGRDGQG